MASSDIDDAVVQRLLNDTTLMAQTPDGVWFDVAKSEATRYVLVSLVHDDRDDVFDPSGLETHVYAVKAVMLQSAGGHPKDAETRIDELLQDGTLPALPPTYALVEMARLQPDGRIRYKERDDIDASIVWQHRGGRYQVIVQRVPTGATQRATLRENRS